MLAFSQDEITGFWLAGEGKTIVEIYESDPKVYMGKIVWMEQPTDKKGRPHLDKMNQDKSLRDREMMGIHILENLVYTGESWDGTLYVAKRGRKVNASLSLASQEELTIEISMMGRTFTRSWIRTEAPQ